MDQKWNEICKAIPQGYCSLLVLDPEKKMKKDLINHNRRKTNKLKLKNCVHMERLGW